MKPRAVTATPKTPSLAIPGQTISRPGIPGPASRAAAEILRQVEAPGINTLYDDQPSVVWASARGCFVTDVDGNRLLDFTSGFGVAALGHRPPAVVRAIRRQLGVLLHGLGDVAAHPARIALAQLLVELAPMQPAQVYWAASGSDAIEIAIKTARLATGRRGLLSFDAGYHGLSHGALAATGRDSFRRPFLAHLDPFAQQLPWGCAPTRIQAALADQSVAALVIEPIPGREGIEVPAPRWLREVADVAASYGTLLIVDEILTGGGRTGTFWACQAEDVQPDLLCFGKALGGGMPLAGVLGRRALLGAWPSSGEALHTGTFIAHPLSCAAALAAVNELTSPKLRSRLERLATSVPARFSQRPDLAPVLREVRGRGLMWALELVDSTTAAAVAREALARGLLVLAGGRRGSTVQLLPPLVISRRLLHQALCVLDEILVALSR